MTITAQQLSDLQEDSAIGTDETIFTDEQIERIWDRVAGADTETLQHEAALALIFRQLLADASKLHDYKAGASSEELSQIYDHLKAQYAMYKPSLDAALSRSTEMATGVLTPKPHQERTDPTDKARSRWFRDTH